MKNYTKDIKHDLEFYPQFRERCNKDMYFARKLIKKFDLKVSDKLLKDILLEYATLDRAWRKVLQTNKKLRGNDYGMKDVLVQSKLEELGYLQTP